MEIEVGGAILELPDGASEAAIQAAIKDFRTSPDFDAVLDKKRGAPARVRSLVGGAPHKDRLANLQQFYPDAIEYGDDNFVFTDPETGRATLYNPPGIDFGDVASVGREVTQAVGGAMGATLGAAGGLAVGAPGGPPGMVAAGSMGAATGAGLGTAAGGTLYDAAANAFGGRVDTRNLGEVATDTALDLGGGAVGQRAGELLELGVRGVVGGSRDAAKQLADAFMSLGVKPPAGAVSGSRAVATVEKALESAPTAASIMQEQAERVIGQTKEAAERLAADFGKVQTQQGAGASIKQAAAAWGERFGFNQEKAYAQAFDLIGESTPVELSSVTALRETLETELAQAPGALGKALNPAINMLKALEGDAAQGMGGIPFDALRQVRTAIGKDIDSPLLAGSTGAQNIALKRIYGALTEDMSAAAKAAGPDAAKKLAVADRYTRMYMGEVADTMQKIVRFDADENAFRFAMQASRDGGSALSKLRRNFKPEEWDTIAATVLNRLGQARPGAQDAAGEVFSVNTFLTNWNKMAPEAKEALFGGSRYAALRPELNKLTQVIGSLKEVEKLSNTSNTARSMYTLLTLNALVGSAGAVLGGAEGAGAGTFGTVVLTAVAPRVAAKLITSPKFVRWLTTPVNTTTGFGAHIGRLGAIAEAAPEIREEIQQFTDALRSIPAPEAANARN